MPTQIDRILEGPEYFYCEKFHVRMRRSVCIERQDKAHASGGGFTASIDALWYEKCRGCLQGEEIRKAVTSDELRVTRKKTREGKIVETVMCKKCGSKPAMARKSGRTVNGYCRECFEVVWREKKRPITEAPLCPRCGERPQTIRKNGTAAGMCSVCRGALIKGEGGKQGEMMNVERRTSNVEFDGALLARVLVEKGLMDSLIKDAADQYRSPEHHAAHLIRVGLRRL